MTHPFILASFKVETAGIWITVICDNCGPNTLFSVSAALVGKINYQCWMLSETFVWRHLLSTEYKCAGLEPSCRLHLTGTLGHQNRSASCQNKSPSTSPAHSSWWLQQSPAALQCQCREDLPCSCQQPALSTGATIHGRYWKLEGQFSQNTQPALFLYTINAQ